jgi:hypothetical protein
MPPAQRWLTPIFPVLTLSCLCICSCICPIRHLYWNNTIVLPGLATTLFSCLKLLLYQYWSRTACPQFSTEHPRTIHCCSLLVHNGRRIALFISFEKPLLNMIMSCGKHNLVPNNVNSVKFLSSCSLWLSARTEHEVRYLATRLLIFATCCQHLRDIHYH